MIRHLIAATLTATILSATAYGQNAADAYYDPDEMAKVRAELLASHGSQLAWLVMADRLEYHASDDDPAFVLDGQGWYGGDIHKFWMKAEGEYSTDESGFEHLELQALYSRAISPFWDLQLGVRHDFDPDPSRTYAVVGLQGLAPYWFEVDGALYLSDEGDLSASIEAEYELRFTQRLILQPRAEVNIAFTDDEAIRVGSGLSTVEAGFRLRYEFTREVAPYLGVGWSQAFGDTKDLLRLDGDDTSDVSLVAGVRFWF